MGRIIAFSNSKGGVGKTTSAINIAAALARAGQRVILVDLDPQGNATSGLGLTGTAELTIYGALLGEHRLKAYPTAQPNLGLVAGSPALSGLERAKGSELGAALLLRHLLAPIRERCDFILLDCPPALELLTINAYTCAEQVYVPLEAQAYAVEGLEKVLAVVERMRQRLNPTLQVGGAFFTRYDGRKILRRDTAQLVRATYPELVLTTTIRESIALSEAPHAGQDIFAYAQESIGAADYQALAAELLTR